MRSRGDRGAATVSMEPGVRNVTGAPFTRPPGPEILPVSVTRLSRHPLTQKRNQPPEDIRRL